MTTEQTTASTRAQDTGPNRSSAGTIWAWLFAVLGVSAVVAIAWNARDYPDARIGNPNVTGRRGRWSHFSVTPIGSGRCKSSR